MEIESERTGRRERMGLALRVKIVPTLRRKTATRVGHPQVRVMHNLEPKGQATRPNLFFEKENNHGEPSATSEFDSQQKLAARHCRTGFGDSACADGRRGAGSDLQGALQLHRRRGR